MRLQPSETPVAVSQQLPQSNGKRSHQVNPFQCLILSNNDDHCELLGRAAKTAQWEALVHHTTGSAANYFEKHLVPFVVIDVSGINRESKELASIGDFVEQVLRSKALLAICGNQNDLTEEIWARQLGAWVYLPGIDHESDLNTLYSEAMKVVEKVASKQQQTKHQKSQTLNRRKANRVLHS